MIEQYNYFVNKNFLQSGFYNFMGLQKAFFNDRRIRERLFSFLAPAICTPPNNAWLLYNLIIVTATNIMQGNGPASLLVFLLNKYS
jgi:hypothetical protein